MDPLQTLLAAVLNVKAQVNAVLAGLPPLDQYEAASDMSYGIRSLMRYANELIQAAENISTQGSTFITAATTTAVTAARAQLLEAKEFIAIGDHQAAVTAASTTAAKDKEEEVRAAITAERATEVNIENRRKALIDEKKLPAVVAHKLPTAIFAAADADYLALITRVQARFKKLSETTAITAESAALTDSQRGVVEGLAEISVDDAGDTLFNTRLQFMETAVTASRQKPAPGDPPEVNPLFGGGNPGQTQPPAVVETAYRANLL